MGCRSEPKIRCRYVSADSIRPDQKRSDRIEPTARSRCSTKCRSSTSGNSPICRTLPKSTMRPIANGPPTLVRCFSCRFWFVSGRICRWVAVSVPATQMKPGLIFVKWLTTICVPTVHRCVTEVPGQARTKCSATRRRWHWSAVASLQSSTDRCSNCVRSSRSAILRSTMIWSNIRS